MLCVLRFVTDMKQIVISLTLIKRVAAVLRYLKEHRKAFALCGTFVINLPVSVWQTTDPDYCLGERQWSWLKTAGIGRNVCNECQ